MSDAICAMPRSALVTGAARRIGRAISEELARQGFALAIHYHGSQGPAEELAREIIARGGKAVTLKADLSDESAVLPLIDRAAELLGPIGCLVNNASVFERDSIQDADRNSWDRHMEANLRAPFVLMQRFAAALPGTASGCIINLLDQRVWNLTPHFVSYTVSKAALWTLTQSMALAMAPRVRVNGIGPGPALPSPRQTDAQFERQCAGLPLRRGTSPAEIAEAVRFILAAPSMTGQMIALDGGQHLGWAQSPADRVPEE